jgi:hydrogenase expression/formation protein HypE
MVMPDKIRLAHGFGGKLSQDLLREVILPALEEGGKYSLTLDAAVLETIQPPLVVSTDSYTVSPRFFPGGNIGSLAVAGTVNDVAMMGGKARYLSLSLIIEEGFDIAELQTILTSIGVLCRETGTKVVTGDTKVVEKGVIDGIFITTTGIGTRVFGPVGPQFISDGDVILLSGTIGDHGTAILNARERLGFSLQLLSDCAAIDDMVINVGKELGTQLHALRDPTRGGIAATLNEFAMDTGLSFIIEEMKLPVQREVLSFLEILGLDILTLANEGKSVLIVALQAVDQALEILHRNPLGEKACVIGHVEKGIRKGRVIMETVIGTRRIIEMPLEAGLPRIC